MSNDDDICPFCGGQCSDGTQCGINIMNKEEDIDGLPIAAVCGVGYPEYTGEAKGADVNLGDELVRRKDVAELITDKIEDLDDKISRKEYFSNDEPEKEAVRVLGELLDEVKSQ